MPPASLSTLAVMNPGPTTARTSAMRRRHSLSQVMTLQTRPSPLMAVSQHRDHVVSGDDAGQPAVFVDDGERDEIVFVEQLRDIGLRRVGRAGDVRLVQIGERNAR